MSPPLPRLALDELLRRYPVSNVWSLDWQPDRELWSESVPQRRWEAGMAGPWLLVTLEDEGQFAIWKATGALYWVGSDGAVGDDPIWTPPA